jgi:hypothetical protein
MPFIIVRALIVSLVFLTSALSRALAQVDWSQPPVACVEEVVPALPNIPCLDLSTVADPLKDYPTSLPNDQLIFWQTHKKQLGYCRAMEILAREQANPGSQSAGKVEVSWMQMIAVEHREDKITSVYEASRANKVPAQVLSGALYQESMFSELGIAEDGGNYSCGIGQINISEWCRWANDQSPDKKASLAWPQGGVDCSAISPSIVKPFYDIALTRLNGTPEYRLESQHFSGIALRDVAPGLPPGSAAVQAKRFQASMSFINNCSLIADGIGAKAHELATLYKNFVPKGLKQSDQYLPGQKYHRACIDHGYEGAYPLNIGWLLAVGTYNAGPRAVDALAYYNNWTPDEMRHPETFQDLTIPDLVASLYWAGAYSSSDDRIHFAKLDGSATSWMWFKPCVLQRHIARVVQHVTLPGAPVLVDSLEGAVHCAKSDFDPSTGALIKSGVPDSRQISSGRK